MINTDKTGFYKIGNNLSLDFINTRIAVDGASLDLLKNFTDVAAWALEIGLFDSRCFL